jgi:spore coat polysaccharide biosynthesis predicted glycosyltransferase SpsG
MRHASIVITYAGMRAMEAACVGAPIILLARNEGEAFNAGALLECGAAIGKVFFDLKDISEYIHPALAIPEYLEEKSKAGMALVDGQGCIRVADLIMAEYSKRAHIVNYNTAMSVSYKPDFEERTSW